MLKLTKHFVRNWRKRVGGEPDQVVVNDIIRKSVRQNRCRHVYSHWGDEETVLAVYCHYPLQISFLVDHYRNNAVSVSSWKNMPENYKYRSLADVLPEGADHG